MKKLLKKKVNVFGKGIPVFAIVILGLALVSAALLPYFGKITGLVTVDQGLLVDGLSYDQADISYDATTTSLENPVILSVHYLENQASVDAEVDLVYECAESKGENDNCDYVNTKYYETNLKSGSLALSLKESDWNVIAGDVDVVVGYSTDVTTGKTTIDSITGLPSGYTLIYYADEEFADDGTRLATPGQAYALVVSSVIPISPNDGNLKEAADYCYYDGYDHCRGIKLWAIRTDDYNEGTHTITWNTGWQSAYYFETDMLGWDHVNDELINPVAVSANSKLDFVIVSEFPKMMIPDTYTLETQVVPAE